MANFIVLSLAAAFVTQQPVAVSDQAPAVGSQSAAIAANTPIDPDRNSVSGADRQICRRQVRIGTLAGFERVCRSAAEWQALARGTRDSWQQIQGTLGATNDRNAGSLRCLPSGVGCL